MGGTAVARFGPDGKRRWVRPLGKTIVSTAADGDFVYVGEGTTATVSMFTDDGLFLCDMTAGRPSGYSTGWIDQALGLYAFTHPQTKQHYVYAEEVYYGKMIRYRIEGLDTIKRFSGDVVVGK